MDNDIKTSVKFNYNIPDYHKWFPENRYGAFIHFGPYAEIGHGEQTLFRDHLDQIEYEEIACNWNPESYNAREWANTFKKAGFRYACLTTRHHDGYCLWNTRTTNYSSFRQAPRRDFVREFCEALREKEIRVGLYYSWADWRIPAYYNGPEKDPDGWENMKKYIHSQLRELCTEYGKIDYLFFDGVWPRNDKDIGSREIVEEIRRIQPGIIINNRLGYSTTDPKQLNELGGGDDEGDFCTPEQRVIPVNKLWESCQVSTWRWWGYHSGERWKSTEELLDVLCTCISAGGNLIMNVGPDSNGKLPKEFIDRVLKIGNWLEVNSDAVFGIDGGGITDSQTFGYETIHGNNLYIIIRFLDGNPIFRLPDITSEVVDITILGTGEKLKFRKEGDNLYISMPGTLSNLPLFPVIRIKCTERPSTNYWGAQRNWEGDPLRFADWGKERWEKSGFDAGKK